MYRIRKMTDFLILGHILLVMKYKNTILAIFFLIYNFHISLGSPIKRNFSNFLLAFHFFMVLPTTCDIHMCR